MAAARAARESGKAAFSGGDLRGAAEAWDEGWRAIEYNVVEDGPLGNELRELKVALRTNSALAHFKLKVSGTLRARQSARHAAKTHLTSPPNTPTLRHRLSSRRRLSVSRERLQKTRTASTPRA